MCCAPAIFCLKAAGRIRYANHVPTPKIEMHGSLGNQAERTANLPSTVEPELGNASGGIVTVDTEKNVYLHEDTRIFSTLASGVACSHAAFFLDAEILSPPEGSHRVQP